MNLREFFWPLLERNPTQEAQTAAAVTEYVTRIRATNWTANAAVVLAEGQRLTEAEADRRRSADNKAAIYLAAVAAIVPLLASTETVFFDDTNSAPRWITVLPLVCALIYLAATALWAVRTLRVTAIYRVDVETLFEPRGRSGLLNHLAREHLVAAMLTRAVANEKITKLKMTHEYILRAAVTFTILLAVEAAWTALNKIIQWLLCPT